MTIFINRGYKLSIFTVPGKEDIKCEPTMGPLLAMASRFLCFTRSRLGGARTTATTATPPAPSPTSTPPSPGDTPSLPPIQPQPVTVTEQPARIPVVADVEAVPLLSTAKVYYEKVSSVHAKKFLYRK